jgi:hypothetical protein
VSNGSFANYTTHNGHIMVGSASSTNLAIGDYEILARDNGAAAPLYLQQEGGTVRLGSGTVATGTKLHITGGEEAGLSTHGYVLVGTTTGEGIAIDDNDIQAKDDGVATYLKFQQSAGPGIQVGFFNTTTHPDAKVYVPFGNDAGLSSDGYVHLGQKTGQNLILDNNEIQVRNNGAASTLYVQDGGGAFRVGTNNLFVDTDGEVGIGTTNPFSKLDVIGRIRAYQNDEAIGIDGTNAYLGLWYNGYYRSKVQQLNDQLYIHSVNKVHIDGDQVAIGDMLSTANDYKLTVTGKIICEELKVELAANWPDYVFRNDYALRPIDDLKTFIRTHGHLPNIPKAADVEKEGFEVGEMNRRLLEKVEELTLYVIQLQEQIDQLKAARHD